MSDAHLADLERLKKVERQRDRLAAVEVAARAVIAAGRPHVRSYDLSEPCPCPQCAAWDALNELLKKA